MSNKIMSDKTLKVLIKINEKFIGAQILYTKNGSRGGWIGRIHKVDLPLRKVVVEYDNGVEQTYSPHAFDLGDSPRTNILDSLYDEPYLKVQNPSCVAIIITEAPKKVLPKNSFLILNRMTGQIVGMESNEEAAEIFAEEQAQDSKTRESFTVFAPQSHFAIKKPIVERIVGIFKKSGE